MARRPTRYSKAGPLGGRGVDPYRPDQQAMNFTPAEARAEYARLRREANRRLETLRRSEYRNMPAVVNRPQEYGALPRNASERQVRAALYDVARFVGLKTSSVQGARRATRQALETLREHGYDFVNKSNILDFQKFMGEVKQHVAAKGLPSEDIVDMWKQAREKRIDTQSVAKKFDFWLEHRQELAEAPRSHSKVTGDQMAKRIGLSID